jgi:large subunit ribosomal protein L5
MPRMQDKYENEIKPALIERFKYGNVMQTPKLEKVNRGN